MLRDNIFPDIQKFIGTLNLVNDSHPTGGLTAKEYHCMAIAIHLNLTKKVDYDFCDNKPRSFNPAERWPNYLAFLVVKDHPKIMEGDGVYNNRRDRAGVIMDSPGNNPTKDHDDLKLTPISSLSNGSGSSVASKGLHAFVSQKRAKTEMKKRLEDQLLMKKVTNFCDDMCQSQVKITAFIDLVAKQENDRSSKEKVKKLKHILFLYKKNIVRLDEHLMKR